MRLSIALLTILATLLQTTELTACCWSDWLCGRSSTPYAVGYSPYAVGYAPYGQTYAAGYAPYGQTYAAGYAPYGQTYAAGYAPVATSPYAAGYATPPTTTSVLQPTLSPAPMVGNGAYQAQRPGYYDNPSVYTGQPVTGNVQTSYSVPVATTLRGAAPNPSFASAGSVYPYQAAYASAGTSGLSVTATTPVAAVPAAPVTPVFQTAPPQPVGGLRRFFGSTIVPSYRSSYYRAPVTYYRPVTSVDPVSGTTVTVQQPCSSYVQQLQRTPYSSLQVGQPAAMQPAMVQPSAGCQTAPSVGGCGAYGQVSPYAAVPSSGVGQVGAIGSAGQFTAPIPSTAPDYYGQGGFTPNASPLSGAPNLGPSVMAPSLSSPSPASGSRGDLAPVDQPQLESFTPAESSYREEQETDATGSEPTESSQPSSRSFWELQNPDDSMAMVRPNLQPQTQSAGDPVSLSTGEFTGASPIQAPDDYVSPFRKQTIGTPTASITRDEFEAPPLPARTIGPDDVTSASRRIAVPVREAALVRGRSTKPVPQKRDSTWYPIQP